MFQLCDLGKFDNAENNFNTFFQDMLLQFPESELKTYETFLGLLKKDSYKLLSALDDEESVGYVIYFDDNQNKILWLDYIAVYKSFHSKGYGMKILEALKLRYKDYKGIYLEVEKPNANEINTIRRIKFYTNLGAQKLCLNYFYPNKNGSLPMDLYFMPLSYSKLPDKEETLSCIQSVFNKLHCDIKHIDEVISKIN